MELAAGTILERYTVERTLGSGGMAVVYLARHNQIGSLHAVKVLTVHGPVIRDRLLQEGRVQAGLRHPNIVAVTDMVEVEGAPALVLEYVRGPTLAGLLRETELGPAQVEALGRGILRGVAAAHRQGLVHRDLKPQNVLIAVSDEGLVPKIADFGLGKLIRSATTPSNTRSGSTMGTPSYMAPEQIRDSAAVDERADVFALGAILYELITGQMAFEGADTLETFERVARGQYRPLTEIAPHCPPRLREAVEGSLRVDPAERFADAGALLDAWTGQRAGHAAGPISEGDVWTTDLLAVADGLAPSAAESLDSAPSTAPAARQDTFALSMDDGPDSMHHDRADVSLSSEQTPLEWGQLARGAALGAIAGVPFALGGTAAVVGSLSGLSSAGYVGAVQIAAALVGASLVGLLAVLWRTGRVSRHHWWLGAPAAIGTLGNLGTGVGAWTALDRAASVPRDQLAAYAAGASGVALSSEVIGLTLVSMLMLATADIAAMLVLLDRGEFGRFSGQRLAVLGAAVLLGTGLWFATTLWLASGAVPFVVFLILFGVGLGAAAVCFGEPDPSARRGEARILVFTAGTLGVLAAAKVVWLQHITALLEAVEVGGGADAAMAFADGMQHSGLGLVVGWGLAAALVGLLAALGPGMPRVPVGRTAGDALAVTLLLVPFAGSKVWADERVAVLTGEVVPAFLAAEAHGRLGAVFTDANLMQHRAAVPGVLDPAFDALQRWRQRGEDAPPPGAIVVEPGTTGLRADDVVVFVAGARVDTVYELIGAVDDCACDTVELTVDRRGRLTQVALDVTRPSDPG